MPDQVVIEQRVLVQVTSEGLMAVPVMVLPGGHLLFNVNDRVLIVPGRPVSEITPLAKHKDEIKSMVFRAMNA